MAQRETSNQDDLPAGSDRLTATETTEIAIGGRQAFGESWPEFDEALRLNSVSWEHVASSFFWADKERKPDRTAQVFGEYHKKLLKSFFDAHGGPEDSYISWSPEAYVVVTTRGELHVTVNTAIPSVSKDDEAAYKRVVRLIQDVQRFDHRTSLLMGRTGRDSPGLTSSLKRRASVHGRSVRATVNKDLYRIIADSIQILERLQRREEILFEDLVEIQEEAFAATQQRFQMAVRRRAAVYYSLGMLIALPVALGLLPLLRDQFDQSSLSTDLLATTMAMGIVGAFVSVMIRLSRSRLRFRDDAVRWEILLLGALRVVLGLIFGLVMFVFVFSGLLPVALPSDPGERFWLFAALGFISGFSETFVPDQLLPTTSALEEHHADEVQETVTE